MKNITFLLLFCVHSILALAPPQSHLMTPEILWKLGRIGNFGISPDANWIVYSVTTP